MVCPSDIPYLLLSVNDWDRGVKRYDCTQLFCPPKSIDVSWNDMVLHWMLDVPYNTYKTRLMSANTFFLTI